MQLEHPLSVLFHCIFILDLTPGFNRLRKENCKTRWETFQFGDLVTYVRGFTIYISNPSIYLLASEETRALIQYKEVVLLAYEIPVWR